MRPPDNRSHRHELVSSLLHGLATALSIAGLAVLVVLASLYGTAWHVVACSVYGAALVLLFLFSTLYHGIRAPRVKRVLRVADHCAIFLLIAGSYTPFMLVTLRGPWGWSLFGGVWTIAAIGIILKTFFTGQFNILSTILYGLMGWMIVIAVRPLWHALPAGGFYLLLAGGLLYTAGIAFYLRHRMPYNHALWHLFVLAGAMCHYAAVMFYVVLRRP